MPLTRSPDFFAATTASSSLPPLKRSGVPGLVRSLGLRSLGIRKWPAAGGAEIQERGHQLPLVDDGAALRKQSAARAAQKATLKLDSGADLALLAGAAEVADVLEHTHRPGASHAIKVDHTHGRRSGA